MDICFAFCIFVIFLFLLCSIHGRQITYFIPLHFIMQSTHSIFCLCIFFNTVSDKTPGIFLNVFTHLCYHSLVSLEDNPENLQYF